jgi:hypothetical protein
MGCPGLLLSGSPEEGNLLGKVRAAPQAPGRGSQPGCFSGAVDIRGNLDLDLAAVRVYLYM